jgi:DNA-binding NarL/FixJ family response regulator
MNKSNTPDIPAQQENDGILLVDDRQIILECISAWMKANSPYDTTYSFRSVSTAIRDADPGLKNVSVVLLNINERSIFDSDVVEDFASLEKFLPNVPVIVISNREDPEYIVEALEQGIRGFIPVSMGMNVVIGAIQLIRTGGTFIPASALMSAARRARPQMAVSLALSGGSALEFTPRQKQVLACLREGKANKTIAYELRMCESTVKVHVRHIMKKLGATNRTQVAFLTNNMFSENNGILTEFAA